SAHSALLAGHGRHGLRPTERRGSAPPDRRERREARTTIKSFPATSTGESPALWVRTLGDDPDSARRRRRSDHVNLAAAGSGSAPRAGRLTCRFNTRRYLSSTDPAFYFDPQSGRHAAVPPAHIEAILSDHVFCCRS